MPKKSYKTPKNAPMIAGEPVAAYRKQSATAETLSSKWNPNVPFQGTQEEWWEHFHRIEEGKFETWEEHQKKFYAWKKKLLESLM